MRTNSRKRVMKFWNGLSVMRFYLAGFPLQPDRKIDAKRHVRKPAEVKLTLGRTSLICVVAAFRFFKRSRPLVAGESPFRGFWLWLFVAGSLAMAAVGIYGIVAEIQAGRWPSVPC